MKPYMFESADGPVKSTGKFHLRSVLSLARTSESAMEFLRVGRLYIIGVCLKLVLNQYVDVECKKLIFIIKTGNDTFLS